MNRAGGVPAEAVAKAVKSSGRGRRADVDVDKIVALYTDGRMTLRQVAKVVGVSHVTVARRLYEKTGQLRTWRLPGEQ